MPLSRRDFCHLLGAGTAAPMILPRVQPGGLRRTADPLIRLDNNENPYGPTPAALAAMAAALPECGRYPNSQPLVAAIARENGVAEANVLLTVGATEGLGICARSFTAPAAPLITGAPTYAAIATATEALGHPVIRVPLREDGGLDLEVMASQAQGAGVIYLCNPNNPTGTLVTGTELRRFIAGVEGAAPATTIVVGEAYHEYIESPGYESAVGEALRSPRVIVNRTFSKLYALAGLRLGYLIAQEETLRRIAARRVPIGASVVAIAAALAVLADAPERERQRRLNTAGRKAAERFCAERGWRFPAAHANYLFLEVGRDVTRLRAACQEQGLLIGRSYPPTDTWARVTIGTPDEMRRGLEILARVLG